LATQSTEDLFLVIRWQFEGKKSAGSDRTLQKTCLRAWFMAQIEHLRLPDGSTNWCEDLKLPASFRNQNLA
jgi:hypothetical protein